MDQLLVLCSLQGSELVTVFKHKRFFLLWQKTVSGTLGSVFQVSCSLWAPCLGKHMSLCAQSPVNLYLFQIYECETLAYDFRANKREHEVNITSKCF